MQSIKYDQRCEECVNLEDGKCCHGLFWGFTRIANYHCDGVDFELPLKDGEWF